MPRRRSQTRRRIERDLHDGILQWLVSLGLELRLAQGMVPAELRELNAEIGRVASELTGVVEDLREAARGSGLIGLRDRAKALGGSLEVSSPPGEGTLIVLPLPLKLH